MASHTYDWLTISVVIIVNTISPLFCLPSGRFKANYLILTYML